MVGKSTPATPEEKRRMDLIKRAGGCLLCLLVGITDRHTSVQHVAKARKRLGHDHTYGACGWHHFGYPSPGKTVTETKETFGPSLAHGMKPYEERFGTEDMLVQTQNFLLRLFDENPWPDHNVPGRVARAVRQYWRGLVLEQSGVLHESPILADPSGITDFSDDIC